MGKTAEEKLIISVNFRYPSKLVTPRALYSQWRERRPFEFSISSDFLYTFTNLS